MKENGEVKYYLSEGQWYNILTSQVVEGSKWQKEHHEYFTMPLLLRPNSILAVGTCVEKPEYDYGDGVMFYLSMFEDGEAQDGMDIFPNTLRKWLVVFDIIYFQHTDFRLIIFVPISIFTGKLSGEAII